MSEYIDLVLTSDGIFFIAPPWTIQVGDYISVENLITGATELKRVTATATDSKDGDFVKLVETYIGGKLTRVTNRYREREVLWEDDANVSE